MTLDTDTIERVLAATGAHRVRARHEVQPLWSGYGTLSRLHLQGGPHASVIVKRVHPQAVPPHPHGWSGAVGDRRKRRSYAVEAAWYEGRARRTEPGCRWPAPIAVQVAGDDVLLVLEDLAPAYPGRCSRLDGIGIDPCLRWLATFHARHLGDAGTGLWEQGCYWHLETRPDEFDALPAGELKQAAPLLDAALRGARFRTLLHGDAKVANFLFSPDGRSAAAVDFQYIGPGPGTRDLAYLLGSCLDESVLIEHHTALLDRYDALLIDALARLRPEVDGPDVAAEWRALHAIAWADFQRFLLGWSPTHAKLTGFAQRLTERALRDIRS